MSRNADPVTTILTAGGWIGLLLFLGWQEFYVETQWRWPTVWWFRIALTLLLALVIFVFALECFLQEMTVRRWATSVLVFGVLAVVFLFTGIFYPETVRLSRWVLIPGGIYYGVAAVAAGAGAKDVL